jgi:hypothetical protein
MRATIETHVYIQAGSVIRSPSDTLDLRMVSSKEKQYMQKVWESSRRLREEYLKQRKSSD